MTIGSEILDRVGIFATVGRDKNCRCCGSFCNSTKLLFLRSGKSCALGSLPQGTGTRASFIFSRSDRYRRQPNCRPDCPLNWAKPHTWIALMDHAWNLFWV